MRSLANGPTRHERLFLAGDAVYLVSSTGAHGLNPAAGDVVTLARALVHRQETGSADLLDACCSTTCLARVRAGRALPRPPDAIPFDTRLRLARLDRLAGSRAAETDLAEAYTGFLSTGYQVRHGMRSSMAGNQRAT